MSIKNILIGFLVLIISIVGFFVITNIRYNSIARSINELAKTEYTSIVLPSELSGFYDEEQHPRCDYDHKVGKVRCMVRYTKYFVTNNETCTEFAAVKKYLLDSHWGLKYSEKNPDECSRMKALGFMPAELLNNDPKKQSYPLEILLKFYSKKDLKEICEDSYQAKYYVNLCSVHNSHTEENTSIYTISISSDFID